MLLVSVRSFAAKDLQCLAKEVEQSAFEVQLLETYKIRFFEALQVLKEDYEQKKVVFCMENLNLFTDQAISKIFLDEEVESVSKVFQEIVHKQLLIYDCLTTWNSFVCSFKVNFLKAYKKVLLDMSLQKACRIKEMKQVQVEKFSQNIVD